MSDKKGCGLRGENVCATSWNAVDAPNKERQRLGRQAGSRTRNYQRLTDCMLNVATLELTKSHRTPGNKGMNEK